MNQRLIFVGGAPGTGKSSTCGLLYRRLPNSIYLDADDLWLKTNPFRADELTIPMIDESVICVLRNYLEARFENVILAWVLHKQAIIDRILKGLSDFAFEFHSFTLVCDESTLRDRWHSQPRPGFDFDHALLRLSQTRELTESVSIECTGLSVEQVVDMIASDLATDSDIE